MLFRTVSIIALLLCFFFGFSCSSEREDSSSKFDDLYQFKEVDLRAFDLPATVFIPDETVGIGASFKTTVEHEEDFKWTISAGPNFELYIEDWGDDAKRLKEFKLKLQQSDVFTSTIIEQKGNYLLYKRQLT
ncbi:MAG: hypothetical protein ACKO68_08705, partial [Bacteroidota bacterium]